MKALWLVSWYPSRLAPLNGDFIKRHAEAVSLYTDVQVIYVIRDRLGTATRGTLVEVREKGSLQETLIYYYFPANRISFLDKAISEFKYRRHYKKAVKEFFQSSGKPDIVHVHVSLKAAPIAIWIKKKYKIDYILSEHWTGFLPEGSAEYRQLPYYLRKLSRDVLKKATAVSTVSQYLADQLKRISDGPSYRVIPNVVDTSIFHFAPTCRKGAARFLHISTLGYQKNLDDILQAFAMLKQKNSNFYLDIFGPQNDRLIQFAASLGLKNCVSFHLEVSQEQLVPFMHGADALILYSRYESFGCVIIEANACGLPVIVSDIAVMHENVSTVNGVFAESENHIALFQKLLFFIEHRNAFDRRRIASIAAEKYNYRKVGAQFIEWYFNVTQH
jgi:glycosyltransferase involved in cell wall biosynthesis